MVEYDRMLLSMSLFGAFCIRSSDYLNLQSLPHVYCHEEDFTWHGESHKLFKSFQRVFGDQKVGERLDVHLEPFNSLRSRLCVRLFEILQWIFLIRVSVESVSFFNFGINKMFLTVCADTHTGHCWKAACLWRLWLTSGRQRTWELPKVSISSSYSLSVSKCFVFWLFFRHHSNIAASIFHFHLASECGLSYSIYLFLIIFSIKTLPIPALFFKF